MKRSAFVLLFAASVLVVNAQTGKGRLLLGGNLNYMGNSDDRLDTAGTVTRKIRTTNLDLNLRGGYFIANNFAVGLLVGYNTRKNEQTDLFVSPSKNISTERNNSLRYGIFGRYYNMIGDSKLAIFGQMDITLGSGKTSNENSSVNTTTTTVTKTTAERTMFNLSVAPGLAYFVTNNLALEATFGSIGYSTDNWKYYSNNGRLNYKTNTSALNFSLSPSTLYFGLSFYFGGGGETK